MTATALLRVSRFLGRKVGASRHGRGPDSWSPG
jgi:hypothetical protein